MSSVDFQAFRGIFKDGQSGFQSSQFRLLEKIVGIKEVSIAVLFYIFNDDMKYMITKSLDSLINIPKITVEQ